MIYIMSSDFANIEKIQVIKIFDALNVIKSANFLANVSVIGVATSTNHDLSFINKLVAGKDNLWEDNLYKVFPNNSFSYYPNSAKFSWITDNWILWTIDIWWKKELIWWNEDFYFAFEQMIKYQRITLMMINPMINSERINEITSLNSKYLRRKQVYQIYSKIISTKAITRWLLDWEEKTIENILDKLFFFFQINSEWKPEVILTNRQKDNWIIPLF